ncbi:MAG TPA: hypothetical protein VEF04_01465 [Blastocatellia bacterium]|nr:hypothetical protein [Blastocatellia bacterium]
MKENDYLWDGTGEPDAEIEQLESLLGKYRYQPLPLALPPKQTYAVESRSSALRIWAIAAMALIALATAVWFGLNRSNTPRPDQAMQPNSTPGTVNKTPSNVIVPEAEKDPAPKQEIVAEQKAPQRIRSNRTKASGKIEFKLDQASIAEAERAKEQLMLALHLASSKLNIAQKKVHQHEEPQS